MEKSRGAVTSDPALNPQIGDRLEFKAMQFKHEIEGKELTLTSLNNWEIYEGVLLSISFIDAEKHRVLGSGVLVGPGIALCAKHVIEEHYTKLVSGELSAQCMGFTSHGLQIWRIRRINPVENSDLVILGLIYSSELPPASSFNIATISTRMPKIGENVLITGFRASASEFEICKSGTEELSGSVVVSLGAVTARYPERRDSYLIPWPVIEVNCPSLGGMSGGPVFEFDG